MVGEQVTEKSEKRPECPLFDKWVLWAHLPHDTDWSLGSYKYIMCIKFVEEMVLFLLMQEWLPIDITQAILGSQKDQKLQEKL